MTKSTLLGGLLALLVFSCSSATNTSAEPISSSSGQVIIKDTLPGIVNLNMPIPENTSMEKSSVIYIKNFGDHLVTTNANGNIYTRIHGVWNEIKLPDGVASTEGSSIAVKDSQSLYLLSNSALWEWNIDGSIKKVNTPAKEIWCFNKDNCHFRNLFKISNMILLTARAGFVDSIGIQDNFVWLSKDNGLTWIETKGYPNIMPNGSDIRGLTYDGSKIIVNTWVRGIWYYDGAKWDSIPYYRFIEPTDTNTQYPIIKYGGVAVLGGKVYTSQYTGELYEINLFKSFSLKSVGNKYSGFSYGLDTSCGALINNNGWAMWKEGMTQWGAIVDTSDIQFAYRATDRKPVGVAQTYGTVTIGDTLFVSTYGADKSTADYPHYGGVFAFDLRQARWCKEAWDRGQVWRDSISAAQKIRLKK